MTSPETTTYGFESTMTLSGNHYKPILIVLLTEYVQVIIVKGEIGMLFNRKGMFFNKIRLSNKKALKKYETKTFKMEIVNNNFKFQESLVFIKTNQNDTRKHAENQRNIW